jgi:ankyrin repeat protein
MTRPEALAKAEPLKWSTGLGTDAWDMFCAALSGDMVTIQSLLDKDPSLIRCEYDYRNPMYFAVRENQLSVAAYLLQRGASPVGSGTSDTLLQIARDRGYPAMQQLLEEAIAGQKGSAGGAVIAEAIRSRSLEKVKALLDESPELVHARDDGTNQPIHWAVMTRQPAMIDELLSRGADINAKRFDGARPLQLCNGDYSYRGWRDVPKDTIATPNDIFRHLIARGAYLDIGMAALTGNTERVRELLEQDPSLANRVSDYVSYYAGSGAPIKNAATGGHIEIVKLLLEHGADPNLPEEGIAPQGHALHSAVVNGHTEIVKLLLEHGAYPNVEIESSADTLSAAITRSDQPMIELLCSYGAARRVHLLAYMGDIQTAAAVFAANPSLANDAYALECAAGQGHESFVRLMLRYQPGLAKQIAVGVNSQGPQDAIRSTGLVEFLFTQGMDASHRNWLGITPLHHFARRDDVDSAAVFIRHGADINAVDEEFRSTPLGYAAKYGKKNVAELLLKQGADPALPRDAHWATPLAWATRRGYADIVELLEEYGAT